MIDFWRFILSVFAVLGGQWGDEGKGKVVDFLSEKADIVARFSGGNNAGHTVINDKGEFKLHLVPSGIFWPNIKVVIGNGTVVDPDGLLQEIDALTEAGIDLNGRLIVSDRAHIVMPYHRSLDLLSEKAKGDNAIGTTGKGIGPAYTDKVARIGIRLGDLFQKDLLVGRLKEVLKYHNAIIENVYDSNPIAFKDVLEKCNRWADRLKEYIGSVEHIVFDAISENKNVLIEGAQGALLDLDHGTYPYVTSSHPTIGGACTGLGILHDQIDVVLGVFKAYSTRVGSGPFVTELHGGVGDEIRNLANEFGTTTGRPRRVGWFDSVAARYSARVNGYTSLLLTRLDVLDGFDSIKVCTYYELDGKKVTDFPGNAALLEKCEPVYEDVPGWDLPTAGATNISQLPKEALNYIKIIEELVGKPIDIISTGPHRTETIVVRDIVRF